MTSIMPTGYAEMSDLVEIVTQWLDSIEAKS